MHAFLFLAFPMALIWYCTTNSKYEVKNFIAPLLMGFLISAAVCTFKDFFTFSSHTWTENSFVTFLKLFFAESFFPVVIVSALFFFFSNNDTEYKTSSEFPLIAAFYAVFIPYVVMTGEHRETFTIIAKPLSYLALTFALTAFLSLSHFALQDKNKKLTVFMIISSFLSLIVPPLLETIWYYGANSIFMCVIAFILFSLSAFFYFIVRKTHIRQPIFMSM